MGFGDRFDDRQPKSASLGARSRVTAAGRSAAIEAFEDMRGLVGIDSRAGIDHRQDRIAVANSDLDPDRRTARVWTCAFSRRLATICRTRGSSPLNMTGCRLRP